MPVNQSNNMIPRIHPMITMHLGENYWFNGCARYVMESLGESDFDYDFFAGITGGNFAQIYWYKDFNGDSVTECRLRDMNRPNFIEQVFAECGYASTFVPINQLARNRNMYVHTAMAYIDRGIPVPFNHWGKNPNNRYSWGILVGYEDYGKTLLYLTSDIQEPERIIVDDLLPDELANSQERGMGWAFIGEKRKDVSLAELYRRRILALPQLMAVKTEEYCFGAEAFRSWARDIDNGRFDGMKPEDFDAWPMYTVYVCNLATNSCCCQVFLKRALRLNPDLQFIDKVCELYNLMHKMWKDQNGEDLEALGGGFNITLAALQDPERRSRIAAKLREFAAVADKIVEVVNKGAECLKAE